MSNCVTCPNYQNCPFTITKEGRDAVANGSDFSLSYIPTETHFTFNIPYTEEAIRFADFTKQQGYKAQRIVDINGSGAERTSYMFTLVENYNKDSGTIGRFWAKIEHLTSTFKENGFDIVRRKVETAPWTKQGQLLPPQHMIHWPHQYLEAHFSFEVEDPRFFVRALKNGPQYKDMYFSFNLDKLEANIGRVYATLRDMDVRNFKKFNDRLNDIRYGFVDSRLLKGGRLDETRVEKTIFDTNLEYDKFWLQ